MEKTRLLDCWGTEIFRFAAFFYYYSKEVMMDKGWIIRR